MGRHKEKSKKHKREKKQKKSKRRHSSSDSSSSEDEWVEKASLEKAHSSEEETPQSKSEREDWMSISSSFATTSNSDRKKEREEQKKLEKERAKYNPKTNVRELNPYWKEGGDGLPKFKKPTEDNYSAPVSSNSRPKPSSKWRKEPANQSSTPPRLEAKKPTDDYYAANSSNSRPSQSPISPRLAEEVQSSEESDVDEPVALTEKELNLLASKMIKAEIMGNTQLATELKTKLEEARKCKAANPQKSEEVLLTQYNSQGQARPVRLSANPDPYSNPKKKKRLETHQAGERVRYFADDDGQSLKQMFENEKYSSAEDSTAEFLKMTAKARTAEDMDDIFTDSIRTKEAGARTDARVRDRAIHEHQRLAKSVDNCRLCVQSAAMAQHLVVSVFETVFLALPAHEPLTEGHCLIAPVRHVGAATELDENEFGEVRAVLRALTAMFAAKGEDVLFFETAKSFAGRPHMAIECVPVERECGDLAPIYFKKAIDECEGEWAQNKKLVSLKGRDVRRAVPKGLPYFSVAFGMDEGYAHVIEDEHAFPGHFAQEIIAGMLDLHHSKWKRPKVEPFDAQSKRVGEFARNWAKFDVLTKA